MGKVKKVTLSGMLFAIGLILPFFIGQIPAIEKRNGSEKAVEFQKKWIPLEELYFEKCRTRSRCDVCFTMCDEM